MVGISHEFGQVNGSEGVVKSLWKNVLTNEKSSLKKITIPSKLGDSNRYLTSVNFKVLYLAVKRLKFLRIEPFQQFIKITIIFEWFLDGLLTKNDII